jgi:hypothetical protein
MITNLRAYERRADAERFETLQGMSVEESIAIGEALLTSDVMNVAVFPDDDQPKSLAIALGIGRKGHGPRSTGHHGRE